MNCMVLMFVNIAINYYSKLPLIYLFEYVYILQYLRKIEIKTLPILLIIPIYMFNFNLPV